MAFLEKILGTFSDKELKRIHPLVDQILALDHKMEDLSDAELKEKTTEFKRRLAGGATLDDILVEAFAVCREADYRVLHMKPYPVQIIGGIVLHRGHIAEMQTGEGKTLMATMPVYLNALSGEGVHVVTVNDYLAKRDSEWMGRVYEFLGLTTGLVTHDTWPAERQKAYAADITYGTNNEFGFDYLRDNMVMNPSSLVQGGHAFAIVDEVDSILIDEARTPLIISGKGEDSSVLYQRADEFAKSLKKSVIVELDDGSSTEEQADGDYVVDEKHRTCSLTESGVKKVEEWFHIHNLAAPEHMPLAHYISNAIKANGVMKRDTDYIVKDGEVVIVDEFTGRLMFGRRYNDGLHQAIEAKEGLTVAAESQTLASITFQNYFRMYKKLAGMTGTASTEAEEFNEIYGLQIVTVPTNKPKARIDLPDSIYKTSDAKYKAVIHQIKECYEKGQPVLVGTTSVEKSELIAGLLEKEDIPHRVLNAKQHEKEAEIIAQAGRLGAVTIATNMAGRGTDILLGGNVSYAASAALRRELQESGKYTPEEVDDLVLSCSVYSSEPAPAEKIPARRRFFQLCNEFQAEALLEAELIRKEGGLFVIGTERHESRRIDNQLRGRAGRQGDPGMTRFFLSMEDDLLRLFSGDKMQSILENLGVEEDIPIESKMLTKTVENAQKRLEGSNFAVRKEVLKFDDVLNQQRQILYHQRHEVLVAENLSSKVHVMLEQAVKEVCAKYLTAAFPDDWDLDGLRRQLTVWLGQDVLPSYSVQELNNISASHVTDAVYNEAMVILVDKEQQHPEWETTRFERTCLLRSVDRFWMEHLGHMEQLKEGIHLRSYAQHDPVVEYRIEGFAMFDEMNAAIRTEAIHQIFCAALVPRIEINLD